MKFGEQLDAFPEFAGGASMTSKNRETCKRCGLTAAWPMVVQRACTNLVACEKRVALAAAHKAKHTPKGKRS